MSKEHKPEDIKNLTPEKLKNNLNYKTKFI